MSFTPRFNDNGIMNNFHWYSQNPFYLAGYGMPNCTCYAWGRFWEIGDINNIGEHKPTQLPTSNGGDWWQDALNIGYYQTGQIPQLGAVACFSDNNGGDGHVAIVEEIALNGDIICSNSAYQGTYFFLTNIQKINNRYDWSHYTFQGFIYNPYSDQPLPLTSKKKTNFPWPVFTNIIRNKRRIF